MPITMLALGPMALLGCSNPPAPAAPVPASARDAAPTAADAAPAPAKPARDFLGDEYRDQFTRRAWVSRCGASGVTPDRMARATDCWKSLALGEQVVVEERADLVRVVLESSGIRYALYLRTEDLDRRVGARTALTGRPGDPSSRLPIDLLPGAAVAVAEQRGDALRVDVKDQGVTVHGWLPDSALVRVYPRPAKPDFDDQLTVEKNLTVLDRPGGAVIAEVEAGDKFWHRNLRRLGEPADGYAQIEVATYSLDVRGFVTASSVTDHDELGFGGVGGGAGWGASDTMWLHVKPGTSIYDDPNGLPFAVTVYEKASLELLDRREEGWVGVGLKTGWGKVTGWVWCPAYKHLELAYFGCTDADDPAGTTELPAW